MHSAHPRIRFQRMSANTDCPAGHCHWSTRRPLRDSRTVTNTVVWMQDDAVTIRQSISDLGMQVAWNGNSNMLASVLFTIALAVSGISIFPFIMYFSSLFSRATAPYRFSILTLISGIPTSIGFILIGFPPWDLYFSYHMISVYVAFGGAVPLSIGFTGAIWTAKKFPRYLVGVGIYASLIILLFLIGLVIWGPSGSETARIIRVVGQKIVVFAIIFGLLIEGWGMWHFLHGPKEKQLK